MEKKNKLYLVWQSSGSYDTYYNKLCGVFDSMEKASELKAKLDRSVIGPEECWTIMPQDVFFNWPTIENDVDSDYEYDYASEYEGYTRDQMIEQEERWYDMTDEYGYAEIEEIYMNEEL